MTISFEDVVNNVKKLIEKNTDAHSFLEMLQKRTHHFPHMRVTRARNQLKKHMGLTLSIQEIRALFRSLEETGAGRYRRKSENTPARFIWNTSIRFTDLVEAVFPDENYVVVEGEDSNLDNLSVDRDPITSNFFEVDDENYSERLITHPFILRDNIVSFIQLPVLLRYEEGDRLSSFIRSLALEQGDDNLVDHKYTLRPDLVIDIYSIPENLTSEESGRLINFVEAYTGSYTDPDF